LSRTEAVRAAIRWYIGSVGSLPPAEDAAPDEIEAIRRGEGEFARGETRRLEDVQRDLGLPTRQPSLACARAPPGARSTADQPGPEPNDG
jgi:hypothetical protein